MRRLLNAGLGEPWRCGYHLAGMALASLGLCGCTGFWDQVSRHDISFPARVQGLFVEDEPLVVLRDSKDGDQRAKALRKLKEPKLNGGNDQDQDFVVSVLVTTAKTDPKSVCRMAAIQTLGHFKDPRAVQGLIDAYYAASTFVPETATVVQVSALSALGETKHPAAVDLLTKVVRAPEPALDVSELEKQQERDRRTAAARALGNFTNYEATGALVHLLKTNRDVALRDRAHESLVKSTGKDLPADAKSWDDFFTQQAGGQKPPASDSKINLLSWFQKN